MAMAVDCAYVVEGNGPPLIMVHGLSARKEIWAGVVQELRTNFTCITYDLRGHGESPNLDPSFGLDELVADVEAIRQKIGAEKMHVIGHSLGGTIAPAYARAHPNRVGALGLLATAAFRPPESRAAIQKLLENIRNGGIPELVDALVPRWFTDDFMASHPEIVAKRKQDALETDHAVFETVFKIFTLTEMSAWLHEIAAPSLVLAAELDADCSPEVNRKIAAVMPNAELVILEGLKHAILLEGPMRVVPPVRDFLRAHPF